MMRYLLQETPGNTNNLSMDQNHNLVPTVGFSQNVVKIQGITFKMYDLGGQRTIRSLWEEFLPGSNVIIFMVDSSDRDRLLEARDELHKLIKSNTIERNCIIAILCNKQDLPQCLTVDEIRDGLEVSRIPANFHHSMFKVICTEGSGLMPVFSYISETYRKVRNN
ncbi:MAG: hypothetical protein MHMPM18_004130 [Marteilia pararefringens]